MALEQRARVLVTQSRLNAERAKLNELDNSHEPVRQILDDGTAYRPYVAWRTSSMLSSLEPSAPATVPIAAPSRRVRVDVRDGRLNAETVPEAVVEASETGARA